MKLKEGFASPKTCLLGKVFFVLFVIAIVTQKIKDATMNKRIIIMGPLEISGEKAKCQTICLQKQN